MATERFRKQFMQDTSLYSPEHLTLEHDNRFGAPAKYPPGTKFGSRQECHAAGVHTRTFAGIAGTPTLGAYSIVVSSGYEDDYDEGDFLIYTGTGGQPNSFGGGGGRQIEDQTFDHSDNAALKKSVETQRPVRVIRGPNPNSEYAPSQGYRYDGLYIVEKAYLAKGKRKFAVCRYELRRLPGQLPVIDNGIRIV
ncbi:PUA-like domain-containing protein [Cyathus striatus]|nr:PUA-like domain-containing protein [Cyathus striatus]